MATTDSQHLSCASCGAPLAGPWCSRCGEEVLDADKLTLRHFFGTTVVAELLNLDGKIWRSLGLLLFRPGFLALEYAAGRRRPYINPLRILLTAIILYALAAMTIGGLNYSMSINGFVVSVSPLMVNEGRPLEDTLSSMDRFGLIESALVDKLAIPVSEIPDAVRVRFNTTLGNLATPLSFTVVLLFALALYLLFHRRRPLFVEHLVFSMHYFSFVLLSSLLTVIIFRLGVISGTVFLMAVFGVQFWQIGYVSTALRRFYLGSARGLLPWLAAAGITLLIYLLNMVFMTGVQLVSGIIAVWLL